LNRGDFQRLSDERLAEAKLLLTAGKWSGAYYLAGYAVECALKAAILALVERKGTIFEDKKFAENCWTHDLEKLIFLAELTDGFDAWSKSNLVAEENRGAVFDWKETARYKFISQSDAERLVDAIDHPSYGVMQWVRQHW